MVCAGGYLFSFNAVALCYIPVIRIVSNGIGITKYGLLFRPEKDALRAVPEFSERLIVIEKVWCVGEKRSIPDVGITAVEHADLLLVVVRQSGGRLIIAVHLNQVSWLPKAFDFVRQNFRRKHRRENYQADMGFMHKDHHHGRQGHVGWKSAV